MLTVLVMMSALFANVHGEKVMTFNVGDKVPLNILVSGDVCRMEGESLFLVAKQTLYVKEVAGELFVKTKISEWQPFNQLFTGKISASIDQDGVVLSADVFERSEHNT